MSEKTESELPVKMLREDSASAVLDVGTQNTAQLEGTR